ncbi:MAG: 4-hydroxythreonine-4-phosphate dehydrogenase PdxA [Pseudomonadales bacterium]|jgi:4-hydroxythreonine-4-phosphate dehydrogenase|nr:4-hydroxythreonine-4-phosphate dehydrogenase PdxA [Pseudomonadales bacterium]MDP6470548.1 4-hydroxythreonine-4-phosphate dehydrogenase PdxA [Pseudomonadales bacterium]MDP6827850.1 4-hydroxythreonine-4-phosphate dehydrogenase PdxA [Pseudomonadales bacterium]MDP6970561.1 4-hydroxythreonine-4-phosphate dehydrogenase PdxA [Pseudomonadales bacterium]|tara:strand:+ start:2529 stop:3575 length:1047 start_codon:yes stop_codon:yes gene_type:complete
MTDDENAVNDVIAVTMGDPAGVGPEVLAKVLCSRRARMPGLLLVGSQWALEAGIGAAGLTLETPPLVNSAAEMMSLQHPVALLDVGVPCPERFEFGVVQASCGRHALRAIETAATLCQRGDVSAMVTCPINKKAIRTVGEADDIGHQEILARLSGTRCTATMLMTPGLRVVHLSTHKSLIEAARYVTRGNVLEKLALMFETLEQWGLPAPRIAVAALNPHAGEGGLIGHEEIDELMPAVEDACARGIDATGPVPADSVFNRAIAGEFDAVLALYHDQGHIAIKVHDFHASTTATLGIPFVRTSVDHGTAFDIAGQGKADAQGLVAAIDAATAIASGQLARLHASGQTD